jgi:reticulon-4-interacting protein 1, mitochondrial
VIDYTLHKPLSTELSKRYSSAPFHAIIDTVGIQDLYAHSASYLAPKGIYCSVGIKPPSLTYWNFFKAVLQMEANALWPLSPWLGGVGRAWKGISMMDPGREMMETVTKMAGAGEIKVVVDSVWGMGDVVNGYAVLEKGHARGKVLVKIDADAEVD